MNRYLPDGATHFNLYNKKYYSVNLNNKDNPRALIWDGCIWSESCFFKNEVLNEDFFEAIKFYESRLD